ncbi:MAG: SGNH/GDSL hydrolase family protein [Burkholderiales bacterium]|nr:SGNH/GDSL hydrolase family protein [Opitutaceae bacterium]
MLLRPDAKLLFIGDSITDAGREPMGEPSPWGSPGLGRGYVSLIESWLLATRPQDRLRVFNRGTSGHTVLDLAARWQTDVLDLKPDFVSVFIGVNDVWRQFDTPLRTETHVLPERYEQTLDTLVAHTLPALPAGPGGLLLATPFFIEPHRADPMRARMDEYGAIVRRLATRHGVHFLDTQAAFDAVLAHVHPMALAWDRIHPQPAGHLILARAFLSSLGCL